MNTDSWVGTWPGYPRGVEEGVCVYMVVLFHMNYWDFTGSCGAIISIDMYRFC